MSDREFDNINGIKVCDQTARNSIPTKTSQLENDSDYATITQVNQAIDNAQLGGGEVDLRGYVTKETGNASQITFADGQTFQAKLDAGTLKGEKGDKGDTGAKGADGINAEIPNFTFAINMIASAQPPSVSTSGTYPNLLITFNIPQNTSESSGSKVVGEINNGTINLIGLSAGTYTLKYEDNNGILNDYVILTSSSENHSLEVK